MNDVINKPGHYACHAVEPITFIMQNDPGGLFVRGNVIKYAMRAGLKLYPGLDAVESEVVDLEKVRRYAEMRINQLTGKDIL